MNASLLSSKRRKRQRLLKLVLMTIRKNKLVGRALLTAHPKWITAIFNYGTYHGSSHDRARKKPLRIREIQALLEEPDTDKVTDYLEAMVVEGLATNESATDMQGFRIRFAACKQRICNTNARGGS